MELTRINEIYAQVGKLSVDLPSDAWTLGPRHISDLISLTRGYLNTISFILQELLQERQRLDRERHAAQAAFSVESDQLLSEDVRVRNMPNIEDRKSQINVFLRDRVRQIRELDTQLLDLGYVEKVVRHRYVELKGTMSDIKVQRALMRDALDTGAFYGDENNKSRGSMFSSSSPSDSGGFSDDELASAMSEVNAMLSTGSSEQDLAVEEHEVAPTPVQQSEPEPQPSRPVQATTKAAAPEVDDFSDLIDGLEAVPTPPVEKPKERIEDPDLARFLDDADFLEDSSESV
jgi:hypothetical protein